MYSPYCIFYNNFLFIYCRQNIRSYFKFLILVEVCFVFQYVVYFTETSIGHFAVCTRNDYNEISRIFPYVGVHNFLVFYTACMFLLRSLHVALGHWLSFDVRFYTDTYLLFMLNGIWIPICFYLSLAGLESARRY